MKKVTSWWSDRLECEITVARWGHWGRPVLVFPTAGGDALEIERMLLVDALGGLLREGRIKLYSLDSVAGRAWTEKKPVDYCITLQNRFDACVTEEVVPAIHADCGGERLPVTAAGASIGAFNAVAALCRHPDLFDRAIAMSGTYDLERLLGFRAPEPFYFCSPMHFVPGLADGPMLDMLRDRFVQMAYGGGRWESPEDNLRMAEVLGAKGIPNHIDRWGEEWDHDWPTWRRMLPHFLGLVA